MTTKAVVGTTGQVVTDSTLIERSGTAPEEFAEIFERHSTALFSYLSRRIGRSTAEDLTAEAFLVAFRKRGRYDLGQLDARPWLYGIATNLLRRHRRTEVRQYRALARTGADPVSDHDEQGDIARLGAATATRRISAALARLSAGERDVLLLVAWEQLSYIEVAQALDIPVGTVRSRLHSARRRMRTALPDLDPTTFEE